MAQNGANAQIREDLVAALEADLIGPFDRKGGLETLPIPPSRYYLAGFLAPQGGQKRDDDPTEDDELAAGDDVDDGDLPAAEGAPKAQKRASYLPASMGLSVLIPPGTGGKLTATVSWAEYTALEPERDDVASKRPKRARAAASGAAAVAAATGPEGGDADDRDDGDAGDDADSGKGRKGTPQSRLHWMRVPKTPVTVVVPLDADALAKGIKIAGADGLALVGKLAAGDGHGLKGVRALSLFLVNRREPAGDKRMADTQFVFQVAMELAFDEGFVGRPNRQHENAKDADDRIADLQYRDHVEYAVGHGVSAQAIKDDDGKVRRVRTTWLPRTEVRRVETRESDDIEMRMEILAALKDKAGIEQALAALPKEYGEWIAQQKAMEVDSDARKKTRDQLVYEANRAKDRISEGIALLAKDAVVLEAFRTMNSAMGTQQRQRARSEEDKKREPKWRLFQLAFILMNLPSVADPHHADRDTAELIFFPTGGGKTEAYLGVIAFTVVLRRLRRRALPDEGLGIAVILRYTLRLLTLDQLARAATLMCALEMIRRERPAELGSERFAVGLWVGRQATANTLSEVAKKVIDYKGSTAQNPSSPFPLTDCPWCQTPIGKASFELRPKPSSPEDVTVSCVNAECPFSARRSMRGSVPLGLPVLFVDEQIYRELPAFLVSTVDKFALLPWRGETGKLFGRVQARENARFFGPADGKVPKTATSLPEGVRPPELIVQDELHLISGPLGTMVGLYETAIERLSLATVDGRPIKPKLLASTATVKRARQQIRALFGRGDTAIFPPPGVDAFETFFSQVDKSAEGRLYVGVAASGRAAKAVMLAVYDTLLGAAQKAHKDIDGEKLKAASPADPYMTIVSYFNALRELGGTRRLVEDEVHSRVRKIELRKPMDWKGPHPWARDRSIGEPLELTSREKTWEIARTKARMEKAHTAPEHVDVVLASNMISVGVDIERLGLMVVAGQPKSTNEYIQATSRVGRKKPGLVVTVYNPVKPRDRSHYERFTAYHEAFYRFVEATSVTPFSGPALQRGLSGVIVAMARQANAALTPSGAAMIIAKHRQAVNALVDDLADRGAAERDGRDDDEVEKIRVALRGRAMNIVDSWEAIMKDANLSATDRCYSNWDPGKKGKPLLFQITDVPENVNEDELKFAAPSSMRDVEGSVHLWVQRGPLGGRRPR